jgi:hypothetical protein
VADKHKGSVPGVGDFAPADVEKGKQNPGTVADSGVGVVVERVGVVAEGQDARPRSFLREEVPGPEDLGAFVPPCPRLNGVAVKSVDEDKAVFQTG